MTDVKEAIEYLKGVGYQASAFSSFEPFYEDGSEYKEAVDILEAALTQQECEKLERAENKPLTMSQLRKMGGKPYYHVSLQGNQNHWAILSPFWADHIEDIHYGEYWLAYAHELEDNKDD